MTIYIEYIPGGYSGYIIKHYDPYTGNLQKMRYIGYTLKESIRAHRNNFDLHYKHLEKIYI
jgi:hypothetical protein